MTKVVILGLYNPNKQTLDLCLSSLIKQSDYVIIVDNSDKSSSEYFNNDKIFYFHTCNIGIAAAQNIGIEKAFSLSFDYILFSDQDTIYPENYFETGIAVIKKLNDPNFGGLTPVILDKNKKSFGFVKRFLFFKYKIKYLKKYYLHVSEAINSGFIVTNKSINKVGKFEEKLFLDWVDFEWCWRARKHGLNIYGTNSISITHDLGHGTGKLFGKEYPLNQKYRYYYIIRNGIYLALYSKNNFFLKLNVLLNTARYFIGYIVFSGEKLEVFKVLLRALKDGLYKSMGKLKN